jgi:hypothetical protein
LQFRERCKQKKLEKKRREEKGSTILSSTKLADPLEEKIQGKKKSFKRSMKNKVKILYLLNLYILFREEHKQKRLLKKQEKTEAKILS